jgi:DNA polymerase-3 subunit chi
MTEVDFYILEDQARSTPFSIACRLAEKAWQQGRRVLVQVDGEQEAQHLERLLWTFREQSFVPHGHLGKADPALNPILIGHDDSGGEEHDVLINLAAEIPGFFSRFERVAEIVPPDPSAKAASRERFRFYRDRGYSLQTHKIA